MVTVFWIASALVIRMLAKHRVEVLRQVVVCYLLQRRGVVSECQLAGLSQIKGLGFREIVDHVELLSGSKDLLKR